MFPMRLTQSNVELSQSSPWRTGQPPSPAIRFNRGTSFLASILPRCWQRQRQRQRQCQYKWRHTRPCASTRAPKCSGRWYQIDRLKWRTQHYSQSWSDRTKENAKLKPITHCVDIFVRKKIQIVKNCQKYLKSSYKRDFFRFWRKKILHYFMQKKS